MGTERKWFVVRFFTAITVCIMAVGAYVGIAGWQSRRATDTAASAATNALSTCARAGDEGYSPVDIIAQCAAAADAATLAAQASEDAIRSSERFTSSRFALVRMLAPTQQTAPRGLSQRLAVFALDVRGVAQWWPTASTRLTALAGYDAAADLRDRSATLERRDFVLRLYLAKGALERIRESLDDPQARRQGISIQGIIDAQELLNRLIVATHDDDIETSDELRAQYITLLGRLRSQAEAHVSRMETRLQENPWAETAQTLAQDLR